MIDVTRFTVPELVKLKELTDSSRSALHTLCSSRKTCTGCQWNTLCIYYRDLWLMAHKELKRRCF
jgi:hypothetical protein